MDKFPRMPFQIKIKVKAGSLDRFPHTEVSVALFMFDVHSWILHLQG